MVSLSRAVLVVLALAAAIAAMVMTRRAVPEAPPARLEYVTTAHQLGVVGYRDPVGALSRDGTRVAFAEGRRLFETPSSGGVRVEIAAAQGQIRHLVALGSSEAWVFEDTAAPTRWWIASARAPARPLFADLTELQADVDGQPVNARVNALRGLSVSPDGSRLAAVVSASAGSELWQVTLNEARTGVAGLEVTRAAGPLAWPQWTPSGEIACTMRVDGRWLLSSPCGEPPLSLLPDVEVIGPLAFSPDGRVHFASPNALGMVDLWQAVPGNYQAARRTAFARDTYAPSAAGDGRVLFKTQSYRTSVAEIDLDTQRIVQLSTLQAETPSYHPDGQRVAVTFGTWRRVMDDAKYPDIAQEIGTLRSMPADGPAASPLEVIAASDSEDQAMSWSPNGQWIVLHSHREQSDDIWLRPADARAIDRRLSFLGRGAEVGWPRWSPDGRTVLYDGASPSSGKSVMFTIGIDQMTGQVTAQSREVAVSGFEGEITHGEWLPDSRTIAGIAKEGPGRHAVVLVPAEGGEARVVHRFASEHDFPGLAVAPAGGFVAFVAPAADGFFQIFRLPMTGGSATQVTFDRTHKTQPAWSPDGRRLAFTIWSYEAHFWIAGA
ncbi:MAG: hypothetical protein ACT4QD_15845 [Acidobacteriota bacterium]